MAGLLGDYEPTYSGLLGNPQADAGGLLQIVPQRLPGQPPEAIKAAILQALMSVKNAVALPGDVAAGRYNVTPTTPGMWSDVDEATRQANEGAVRNSITDLAQLMVGMPGGVGGLGSGARGIKAGLPAFERTGEYYDTLYHGGSKKIGTVDPAMMQFRDSGFYGKGFYTAETPDATKGYGGRLSKFGVSNDARVLLSSLKAEDAPAGLVDAIKQDMLQSGLPGAIARGKEQEWRQYVDGIANNHLEWKNAVDRFAERNGYDIVRHGTGEVVVKNPKMLLPKPQSQQ